MYVRLFELLIKIRAIVYLLGVRLAFGNYPTLSFSRLTGDFVPLSGTHDRKGCTELSDRPFLDLPTFGQSNGMVYVTARFRTQKRRSPAVRATTKNALVKKQS